jgi:PAS domain S-box-containing protein
MELERDNAELRRVQEELRQSKERFQGAFDYAAIGMALVATDGRWLQVNRSVCDITGYSQPELLATTFQAITHPEDLDADLEYVRQMLAGEIRHYHMEKRYFHKRGHIVWILLSVSLVHDAQGDPLYFISQIQDITRRKEAEKEKESLIRQLQDVLATVKTLQGLLPVCAWCKQVRNDEGYWLHLDAYVKEELDVTFTHGICPTCLERVSPSLETT